MKRAIVLSGGGAKGAYQIGVWKALRKMHMDYSIVTGTSVGALNGAFFVQNDYYRAVNMWYNMSFSHVFDHMDGDYSTIEGKKDILLSYAKGVLDGGMDISRLEKTLDKYLNVKKFYSSKIDYGLITVDLTDLKQVSIRKKEIPSKELKDYLIASASCFPAFKVKKIHGKNYIDGGYYDNIPINLAIELGADEVIAVDLKAVGLKQKLITYDVPVTYIAPRADLGSFLVFDKTLARRAMRLGYHDAMKTFQKLDGNLYTFRLGEIQRMQKKYFKQFVSEVKDYLFSNRSVGIDMTKITKMNRLLKEENQEELITQVIDFLGESFSIPVDKVYTTSKFHRELLKRLRNTELIELDKVK
ncbi:MAG: patatin-like phospholipase family protein, partial [Firmicutes bacterium]|nr:patatin-like phospholipase family protein [Bacillota bacterium]